jgi:hypothetical protein
LVRLLLLQFLPFQFLLILSIFSLNNTSSPFFLHNGDSPKSVFVPQQLIDETYNTWSRSMIMALTAKNKLRFVDFPSRLIKTDLSSRLGHGATT